VIDEGFAIDCLDKRRTRELRQMLANAKELEKLEGAYHRFQDLLREQSGRRRTVLKISAVLGGHGTQYENAAEIVRLTAEEARRIPKLWEALEIYLSCVGEATVADFRAFLTYVECNLQATPQAIDSAVKTHPDLFEEVHKGRERSIRLKREKSTPAPLRERVAPCGRT
jgi:hypothetical protein